VQEKIDGSQFSFCKAADSSVAPVNFFCKGNPKRTGDALFNKGIAVVSMLHDKLNPELVYHSEYMSKPRHNAVTYDRLPKYYCVVYDIRHIISGQFFSPAELQVECDRLGLECVALLFDNSVTRDTTLDAKAVAEDLIAQIMDGRLASCLGTNKPEGVVLKCHNFMKEATHELGTTTTSNTKLKFVTSAFKERKSTKIPKTKADSLTPSQFLRSVGSLYDTQPRLRKGIQRMRDIRNLQCESSAEYREELEKDLDEDLIKEYGDMLKVTITAEFQRWVQICRNVKLYPQAEKKLPADVLHDPVYLRFKSDASSEQLLAEHLQQVCLAALECHNSRGSGIK
jgi:hypothetical protein